MSMFKVGDKVLRKESCGEDEFFRSKLGRDAYYTVTAVSGGGGFIQVDGWVLRSDKYPWSADNFDLYQEPEDELPPAPTSVLYIGAQVQHRQLKVHPYNRHSSGEWYLDLHIGGGVIGDGKSCLLSADDVLQLAHDLRRMAMELKRKEKAQ